jgi:large subunit ribosomal protein L13
MKTTKSIHLFLINCENKSIGRLSSYIAKIFNKFFLYKKNSNTFFVFLNTKKLQFDKNKGAKTLIYSNTKRPGNLKKETALNIYKKNPSYLLKRSIQGMFPKSKKDFSILNRIYTYSENQIVLSKF